MAIYECVYIARQELTAAQTEQLSKDLTKIVSSNSGEIKRQEYWGLRNLAYKIRKNRKGHYTMFHIEAPASAIEELERNMRLNEDILRYLTVKIDKLPDGPSVMMTARPDRPRRTDRYEDNVSVKDPYTGNSQTDGEASPESTSSN